MLLDLGIGPLVVELAPGPLIVCSMDVNQRWVADMGLPGPDAGKGGKHLLLPPDYAGEVPSSGYYIHRASSNRQIVGVRSLPVNGDVQAAKERLKTIKVYPYQKTPGWQEPQWLDVTGRRRTPRRWRGRTTSSSGKCWPRPLTMNRSTSGYHDYYGELAALRHREGQTVCARLTAETDSRGGRAGRQRTDARAVVWRSPSRP